MIHKAMVSIMRDVDAIKKGKTNTAQDFKYRGIDDVMNALHDSFAKNGVFIMQEIIDRKEVERQTARGGVLLYVTLTIKFKFIAEDGSFVESTISGTAMDSGDKADNKCMSIAAKYCLMIAFLIPTEDLTDPDAQTHEVLPKTTPQVTKQAQKPTAKIAMTTEAWSKLVDRIVNKGEDLEMKIRATYILTQEQDQFLLTNKPTQS